MNAATLVDIPRHGIPAGAIGRVILTLKEFTAYDPPAVRTVHHVVAFPGLSSPIACTDDQVTLYQDSGAAQ